MIENSYKILRLFPAELSHSLTIKLLKLNIFTKNLKDHVSLHQHLFGLDFNNPLGLAAGFDKNAEVVSPLLSLGFGFVEIGTVTPLPQIGNKKPRIFRLFEEQAVINHLGFNNRGVEYVKAKLSRLNLNNLSNGVVGINIGKNLNTKNAIDDYCLCFEDLGKLAHYTTINVSSPNTPGLRDLQNRKNLEKLIKNLQNRKETNTELKSKPLLLKISPDLDDQQLRDIALISLANGIEGLIISNTTIDRPNSLMSKAKNLSGGLSGKPLFKKSTRVLKKIYALTNGSIPIIGVGGISNGEDCYQKIKSGASLVQLYTALVFKGPKLINHIKRELIFCLKTDGFKNIKEAIGKDV